jgi:hypothetical protein
MYYLVSKNDDTGAAMDRGFLDCRTRQFSAFWLVTRKAPAGSQTPDRGYDQKYYYVSVTMYK